MKVRPRKWSQLNCFWKRRWKHTKQNAYLKLGNMNCRKSFHVNQEAIACLQNKQDKHKEVPSFETMPLMTHGRKPRIQKMKCLAKKLTEWRRIEKLWQIRKIEKFTKIERFALCKSCYRPSTKWLRNYKSWKVKKRQGPKFRWIWGITEFPRHGIW